MGYGSAMTHEWFIVCVIDEIGLVCFICFNWLGCGVMAASRYNPFLHWLFDTTNQFINGISSLIQSLTDAFINLLNKFNKWNELLGVNELNAADVIITVFAILWFNITGKHGLYWLSLVYVIECLFIWKDHTGYSFVSTKWIFGNCTCELYNVGLFYFS